MRPVNDPVQEPVRDPERDPVREIAQAVLYEGYLLWPYRRSALKNQRRWTFGGVFPEGYSTAGHADDPWIMRTECLLEPDADADGVALDVRVRFLQVVRRDLGRPRGDALELVDELVVGGERHLAWQEAVEREVAADGLDLGGLLDAPRLLALDVPAGDTVEWLPGPDADGAAPAGAVIRSWQGLRGGVRIGAERAGDGAVRIVVEIANTTAWDGGSREDALERALISTHTVLHAAGGRFVSLTDPPPALAPRAAACRNDGTWPVLVGEDGDRHTLLSSPIILSDYPRVAPESPGDFFDAAEIDQLLTLSTMALTEEEQRELRAGDPRARAILDRCASLAPEQLMRLHGTFRDVRALPQGQPGRQRTGWPA
jgi:hypothetical protein